MGYIPQSRTHGVGTHTFCVLLAPSPLSIDFDGKGEKLFDAATVANKNKSIHGVLCVAHSRSLLLQLLAKFGLVL